MTYTEKEEYKDFITKIPMGKKQLRLLEIIKSYKEISIKQLKKEMPFNFTSALYNSLNALEYRGLISIRLPKGHSRNYKYCVFIKDYKRFVMARDKKFMCGECKEKFTMDKLIKMRICFGNKVKIKRKVCEDCSKHVLARNEI